MLSGRLHVPSVAAPVRLDDALAVAVNPFFLHPAAEQRVADQAAPTDLTLFVGPEGGWSPSELALAGDRILSLGRRNLRAETAALAALAISLAVRGE